MDSRGVLVRDRIVVDQTLVDTLKRSPSGPRCVVAREIVFGTAAAEIAGHDFIFVAETIRRGGDAPFTVRALPLQLGIRLPGSPPLVPMGRPGRNGNVGPRVEIYCRHYEGVRIQSIGGDGETGETGAIGSVAIAACGWLSQTRTSGPQLVCVPPTPDPTGKRGGPGGNGGDGGAIVVHFVTKSSDGALHSLGGSGGLGAEGGAGGKILQRVAQHGMVNTVDPRKRGDEGSQGEPGTSGKSVPPVLLEVPEPTLWDSVRALFGGVALRWTQYRFRQGERLFSSYLWEAARQEFDAVLRLLPANLPDHTEDPFDPGPTALRQSAKQMHSFLLCNKTAPDVAGWREVKAPADEYVLL